MNYKDLHIGAILLGVIINFAGSYISIGILLLICFNSMGLSAEEYKVVFSNDLILCGIVIVGLFWSFLVGYMSARIAKKAESFNASIIGVIGLAIAFNDLLSMDNSPFWYTLVSFLAEIPVILLGAKLAKKVRSRAMSRLDEN
ncbi:MULTISPECIES: hypothetical protein [unclassified Paenibacillus]|uniref:hypothetical protein n=1 Tax=unclassified Paenibacillus TaxID=185978 RepID=UPI003641B449